jgi:hypothetical protein
MRDVKASTLGQILAVMKVSKKTIESSVTTFHGSKRISSERLARDAVKSEVRASVKGNELQILVSKNHGIGAQGDMRESIMIKLRGLIIESGENIESGSGVNKNLKNIELVQTEETKFEGNAKIAQGKFPDKSQKFMTLYQRPGFSPKVSDEGSKVLEVIKPAPSPATYPFAYSNNTDPFPPTVIKEWASMTTAEFSKVREAARVIKIANASPKNNPRPFDFSGRKILNDALCYDAQLPPVNSKVRLAGY